MYQSSVSKFNIFFNTTFISLNHILHRFAINRKYSFMIIWSIFGKCFSDKIWCEIHNLSIFPVMCCFLVRWGWGWYFCSYNIDMANIQLNKIIIIMNNYQITKLYFISIAKIEKQTFWEIWNTNHIINIRQYKDVSLYRKQTKKMLVWYKLTLILTV